MKVKESFISFLAFSALLAGLAIGSIPVYSQAGGTFEINKSVIAGGGGQSSGGGFTLDGTIGQSISGTNSTGGAFSVVGGFWGGSAVPSAGVTVSGRVLTASGLALRNAVVSMRNPQGLVVRATTSSFGIFTFENVPTGSSYLFTVSSKRYRYAPQTIEINGSISNLILQGLE